MTTNKVSLTGKSFLMSSAVVLIALVMMLLSSCKEQSSGPGPNPTTPNPAVINGRLFSRSVLQGTVRALNGASVKLLTAAGQDSFQIASDTNHYTRTIAFTDTLPINLTVTISHANHETFNSPVLIIRPGVTYTRIDTLRDTSSTPVVPGAAKVASISLVKVSTNQIGVRGSGGQETSTITFIANDRAGNPIGSQLIKFRLKGAGGGAFLFPDSSKTDTKGQVLTILTSGILAGVFQVQATSDTGGPTLVTSSPVPITVAGGMPDSTHFSIAFEKFNIPGWLFFGLKDKITAFVGDKYGNPVQPNTAVYFGTNGGIISASAYTGDDGSATTQLQSAEPRPSGGLAKIIASTIGDTGKSLKDSGYVCFSGAPIVNSTDSLNIQDGASVVFHFSVNDLNARPMSAGTKITVSLDGNGAKQIKMSGDVDNTLTDHINGGPGVTTFVVTLQDTVIGSLTSQGYSLTVDVQGPNGNLKSTYNGQVLASTSPLLAGIASLRLLNVPPQTLSVRGVGQRDTVTLSYVLLDSARQIVRRANVFVAFVLIKGTPGTFSPGSAYTDANGQVSTLFQTGIVPETDTIQAKAGLAVSDPLTITITPGPPSLRYFTMNFTKPADMSPKVNFPGRTVKAGEIGEIRVSAKDRYGNIVSYGTPIAVKTNAGSVDDTVYTDATGAAASRWLGKAPYPPRGAAIINAMAVGERGVTLTLTDSATYSGLPMLKTAIPANFYFQSMVDTVFNFKLGDSIGNPLSENSKISVTVSGAGASSIILGGDVDVTLPDTRDTNWTNFKFTLRDTNFSITSDRALQIVFRVTSTAGQLYQFFSGTLQGMPISNLPRTKALVLTKITSTTLAVKGTGGTESTLLTYEIEDSLGRRINKDGDRVIFTHSGVPGGTSPDTTYTSGGVVQTLFRSDTMAGIARISAHVGAVSASDQSILIVGGKPAKKYFTFVLGRPVTTGEKVNYPGGVPTVQKIGIAQVQAGDRYGNPVPEGTAIYFTTNAGMIQTGTTDKNGLAAVDWYGGDPYPAGGVAVVKASTVGYDGLSITDSAVVTYSGQALIVGGPPSSFVIPGGGTISFTYRVQDALKNPLAEGTQITVSADGDGAKSVIVTGNVSFTMPDTRDTNATKFSVTVRDTNLQALTVRPMSITISVSGPNGTATTRSAGVLQPNARDTTRSPLPASIALLGIESPNVQVIGTGGKETSVITWEVRDSLGFVVDSSYKISFQFSNSPGGGEYISPDTGYCDSHTGRINSIIHSGTKSGDVQIIAKVYTPTGVIVSTPAKLQINAGLPDQAHFTVWSEQQNMPAFVVAGTHTQLHVIAGDKYSNPVTEGTSVYFSSSLGVVETRTGFTDVLGQVNGTLGLKFFGENPKPAGGFGWVYAQTVGQGGVTVKDSVRMLFSGSVILDSVTVVGGGALAVDDSVSKILRFRVYDFNVNPISAGNAITVTITGASAVASKVSPSNVLPDALTPYWTIYEVVISKDLQSATIRTGAIAVSINVSGPNGDANASIVGQVR